MEHASPGNAVPLHGKVEIQVACIQITGDVEHKRDCTVDKGQFLLEVHELYGGQDPEEDKSLDDLGHDRHSPCAHEHIEEEQDVTGLEIVDSQR